MEDIDKLRLKYLYNKIVIAQLNSLCVIMGITILDYFAYLKIGVDALFFLILIPLNLWSTRRYIATYKCLIDQLKKKEK